MTTDTTTTTDPADLLDTRATTWETQARTILDTATAAARPLTDDERRQFDALTADAAQLRAEVGQLRQTAATRTPSTATRVQHRDTAGDVSDDRATPLRRDQSVADWSRRHEPHLHTEATEGLSFGRVLRGLTFGDWQGAEREQRAMSIGVNAAGGFLVPTPLATDVIDRARNAMRVMQAGATTIPMFAATQRVGRLDNDPAAAWHAENVAIPGTDATFGSVTLTAQTLTIMAIMSLELFEDVDNIDTLLADSLAQSIALELDRVALRGSGTSPEPRGVRNQAGVTITSAFGANGAVPTNYDFVLDGFQVLRSANFEPSAVIAAPRTKTTLNKLKDTQLQPLQPPPDVTAVPWLSTNQVPVNSTTGTSTDTSDVFIAEWRHLLIGLRTGFNVRVLTERFIDNGQIALFAYLRGDVQLARAAAFNVIQGARP